VSEVQFDGRRRVVIEGVSPAVDGGQYPARRVAGDVVELEADIFADGHDVLAAVVLVRHATETRATEMRMQPLFNDRWQAEVTLDRTGAWYFTVEAWVDHFQSWLRDLKKRGGADFDVQRQIGVAMIGAAVARAKGRDAKRLERFLTVDDPEDFESAELRDLMWRNAERRFVARTACEYAIEVDRRKAAFSTWYELFPRSFGTFRDVEAQIPRLAKMGFDVLYLPPIHPIGKTFRKGKNNKVGADTYDVGSPWAIGSDEGGHTSVHPQLGTIADFRNLCAVAEAHGVEVALDIAFQASPDHPWTRKHRQWFLERPDGTIQYAENPPKKYQDIYPFHFESDDWQSLWKELRDVFLYWIGEGVRIFRVDNPHTKPLPFWQWCIAEVKRVEPDALFLAEAFTRPKIMYWLAKAGFSQSYTYFAWRNTKREIIDYFETLTRPPVRDFFRPNAWPNTPDILTEYLQYGGRPAFIVRLILAATLSASYGIYGPAFERMQHVAREPGSEEYLDSEKYEVKPWSLSEDDLSELITVVNRVRRENPALQQNDTLTFHETDNEEILCYSKSVGENVVVSVVNLDPHNTQAGWIELDLEKLDLGRGRPFQAHDLLTGARHMWHGGRNYVQLNPHVIPAHIFKIRRKVRSERDFEYFL
jgi:starch synthase (maltosyl-transferring)